ncbi:MAG: hypothetical protein ABII82_03295, partial [Verrucomicrobiota bacterium]
LAMATSLTVFIISYSYSRIIEHFPHGGGGYMVATQTLGPKAGVLSGSSLLQIPPLAEEIIPYPQGDRSMLQIAAFTNNMWAPVASTLQMLAPNTRITIFMTDTAPTPDNPNPTSVEYRKVAEVLRPAASSR